MGTGSHRITLPASGLRTLRLERSARGSTFHLALWFIGAGDSIGEGASLSVGTTADDTDCGSASVFRPTVGEPEPLLVTSASTWTDQPEHPCGTADELFVTVPPPRDPSDIGRAATLMVYEEPPLSVFSFGLLDEPTTPTWAAPESGPSERIDAGTTPADAPILAPGTVDLDVQPGHTAVVGIPLGWGQGLRAQVDGNPEASVQILGPMLGKDVAATGTDDRGARAQSWTTSYVQRNSLDPTRAGATLAGVHYVLVSVPASAAAIGLSLTVAVDGGSGDGTPDYILGNTTLAPRGDSRLVDGTLIPPAVASPDTPTDESSASASAADTRTAIVATAAILLAGAAALVVRRERRRHRPTRRADRGRGR